MEFIGNVMHTSPVAFLTVHSPLSVRTGGAIPVFSQVVHRISVAASCRHAGSWVPAVEVHDKGKSIAVRAF